MAEFGSWPSIRKHGLLSTSALLDLFEVSESVRHGIESRRRPESVRIHHDLHGSAVIRDQKPLHEGALQKLIDGMSTGQYYKLLNGKTFFWVRKERLERLLNARAYREKSHVVLTVDTSKLLKMREESVYLSPINSGAIFGSGRRGTHTFKSIKDYPFEEMRKKRNEDAVVELAVDYAVKDIADVVVRVETWIGAKPLALIWERQGPSSR